MLDCDTAWQLALFAGLVWDDDREALAPLVDATIVWADEDQLDEIAAPIVRALWADGLRDDIERALRDWGRAPPQAFADLDRGPEGSRLALAYVRQGAVDLTDDAMLPGNCLCCVEDMLEIVSVDRRDALVLDAAVSIVLRTDPGFGTGSPGDDRLRRARDRLRAIATLAEGSLPRLAAALPGVAAEDVWNTARMQRRAETAARN